MFSAYLQLLAVKTIGGESEAAWRSTLDHLIARGLRTPDFLMTNRGAGLERVLAAMSPDVSTQSCTVHKHRNLLAHTPYALHETGYPGQPVCDGFLATAA